MAQSNRKHEAPETPPAADAVEITPRDSLVMAIEDGDGHGHYQPMAVPVYDPANSNHAAIFAYGWKNAAVRDGQSKAKAEKDKSKVGAVLLAWAAGAATSMKAPSIETVGDFILRHATADEANALKTAARAGCAARIAEIKGNAATDAEVDKSLASFIVKYPSKVEAALREVLAAGYTPKARGTGKTKTDDATPDYAAQL